MRKNGSCSKLIRLESWGSKFVFRDTRNCLPPTPRIAGSGIPLVYTLTTITTLEMEQKGDKKRNKGGRPKKGATDKMTYRVAVKMAAADYFCLLTRAYEAGVSPSEYMRECFRNGYVKERLSKEHSDYVRKLCGMANNLNQLARRANAGGYSEVGWDCKVAVARIHELINKIGI